MIKGINMNNEIKEILDNFKDYELRYKQCNENQFIIFYRDIHLLLDYITNLQTDNKRLQHNEKVFKGRNEKAIEYLGINEEILETCEIYDVNGIEVYKILKGVDKK